MPHTHYFKRYPPKKKPDQRPKLRKATSRLGMVLPLPKLPAGVHFVDLVFNVAHALVDKGFHDSKVPGDLYDLPAELEQSAPRHVLRLNVRHGWSKDIEVRGLFEPLEFVKLVYYRVVAAGAARPSATEESRREGREAPEAKLRLEPLVVDTSDAGTCPAIVGFYCRLESADIDTDFLAIAASLGIEEYLEQLEAEFAMAPAEPVATPYREYFFELDKNTNPTLLTQLAAFMPPVIPPDAATQRKNAIAALVPQLADRVQTRYNNAVAGADPPTFSALGYYVAANVALMSKVQFDLIVTAFKDPGGGLFDLTRFEEAYEMFANGELRTQIPSFYWTTHPSSSYFVYFAEFAFMALEHSSLSSDERNLWEAVLPVLIRTQEIFFRVYAPPEGGPRDWNAYRACNYSPLDAYACSEKSALRQVYAALPFAKSWTNTLALRMSRNLLINMPDGCSP